jgi:hypothetical protein
MSLTSEERTSDISTLRRLEYSCIDLLGCILLHSIGKQRKFNR